MNSCRNKKVMFHLICIWLTGILLTVSVEGKTSDVSRYDLKDILDALPTTVWGMVNLVKEKLKDILPPPENKTSANTTMFTDCADLRHEGYAESNRVYTIWPRFLNEPIKVVCDMDTEGGGWTIIQRRGYYDDKPQDFNQSWYHYSVGFGSLNEDFWLDVELRVDLEDFSGKTVYAKFSHFLVMSERRKYQMFLGAYSGNAGDSLKYHNGSRFSTKDQDNDENSKSCSTGYGGHGGWWFKSCVQSTLNGIYHKTAKATKSWVGIAWNTFGGSAASLKRTEMKIRPSYFVIPH
ncbi:techylectin-5B-like isoform X2 [Tachypleus tridentatus]|uniref:techylectin-5B-like isoform X2 n=1 Tax=Tachypleus tridentatus TaxID=6853 RepID=UPI003FD04AF9